VTVSARVTYRRPDGTGLKREFPVGPPEQRTSFRVGDEPGLDATEGSTVVRSLDPAHPFDAWEWAGQPEGHSLAGRLGIEHDVVLRRKASILAGWYP
jgi:hypothetical protein